MNSKFMIGRGLRIVALAALTVVGSTTFLSAQIIGTAVDSSGNGRHGSFVETGAPLWSEIPGVPLSGIGGNAVNRLGGTTSWVAVPATDDAAFGSTSFTFEAWLNAPDPNCTGACPGNYMVRGAWVSTDTVNPGVSATFAQHSGGNISAGPNGGCCGQQVVAFGYPAPAPGWHHVVHTFEDNGDGTSTTSVYFDGVAAGPPMLVDGAADPVNNIPRDDSDFGLAIGILPFAGDNTQNVVYANPIQGFTGGYDEFAYYDTALSASQVSDHFAAASGAAGAYKAAVLADNPAGYWQFESIPEPGSVILLVMGLLSICGLARRRS